jgi:hypothetical protein
MAATLIFVLCCNIAVVREMRTQTSVDEGRAMRGQAIYQQGEVEPVDRLTYHVNSQSGHGVYTVEKVHGV